MSGPKVAITVAFVARRDDPNNFRMEGERGSTEAL